jgi:hypothetical protein
LRHGIGLGESFLGSVFLCVSLSHIAAALGN